MLPVEAPSLKRYRDFSGPNGQSSLHTTKYQHTDGCSVGSLSKAVERTTPTEPVEVATKTIEISKATPLSLLKLYNSKTRGDLLCKMHTAMCPDLDKYRTMFSKLKSCLKALDVAREFVDSALEHKVFGPLHFSEDSYMEEFDSDSTDNEMSQTKGLDWSEICFASGNNSWLWFFRDELEEAEATFSIPSRICFDCNLDRIVSASRYAIALGEMVLESTDGLGGGGKFAGELYPEVGQLLKEARDGLGELKTLGLSFDDR